MGEKVVRNSAWSVEDIERVRNRILERFRSRESANPVGDIEMAKLVEEWVRPPGNRNMGYPGGITYVATLTVDESRRLFGLEPWSEVTADKTNDPVQFDFFALNAEFS